MTSLFYPKNKSIQAPSAVVMIRPHHFYPNPQTAADNAFQTLDTKSSIEVIKSTAFNEVSKAAQALEQAGVIVHLFEDVDDAKTPDSVFPNNWFSTHSGGYIALYPMYSNNRRQERRMDIIEMLKATYRVQEVIDYSGLEYDDIFLEGTGAMVLDHLDRVAYTVNSNRANPVALERFCTQFNFEPMAFFATDSEDRAIYHTNVMMNIGTAFVMIGLDAISDKARRNEIKARLAETGRDVIALDQHQLNEFAGNAMELSSPLGRVLALSARALASLRKEQIQIIEQSAQIVPLAIPTIEMAGGSVRCMLAGIHLSRR